MPSANQLGCPVDCLHHTTHTPPSPLVGEGGPRSGSDEGSHRRWPRYFKRFADAPATAVEIATGETKPQAKPPAGLTYADWAAYTLVARVVLNLDESVTKE